MSAKWEKDSDVIFERFAAGIDDAISGGEELKCADADLQYSIKLQNERLRKNGLRIKYDLTPRGHLDNGLSLGTVWKDGHYESKLECRSCLKDENYYLGGKLLFRKKECVTLYQTVTDTNSPENIADDEYICPDCGAVSKVGELAGGCHSCGTKFKISELYPKISNFYFYPDVSRTHAELGKTALPCIIGSILAIYLPMFLVGISTLFFNGLTSGKNSYRAMQAAGSAMGLLIGGAFFAVFFGVIVGWFITSFIFMARLASFASQRIPMAKYLGCQKEFENFMKKFSPEFSYEIFAGKTVSLIKTLIYSDTPTELPFYNGPEPDPRFKNIVDVTSMGAVGITKMETVGDYVLIGADVYLENTYFTNGKIYRKNEMFKTVMKKNVSAPVDMRFKITSIHCPSCGASFDATKNKSCPYCSSTYKMEDMDWSIEELVK